MVPVIAVDFGASSIRVCRVELSHRQPRLEVVHRHHHQPIADADGHLRWEWARLVTEMEKGMTMALERGPAASIGIDTWGVDYGLLDARGALVAPPYSYRDHRTGRYRTVVERIGETSLYETTGVQPQPINTIFQLASHDRSELSRATTMLMLPELLAHHLTGATTAERTSASTSGLVDITTGDWSRDLITQIGVEPSLFLPVARAGTRVGSWRDIPVHLVGGHDTASAVAAMGARPTPTSAFVSAGTWLLVGREQSTADRSDAARLAGFTNEAGCVGGVRLLKNLAGFWVLEGCRKQWGNPALAPLLDEARALPPTAQVIDLEDPALLNPADMLATVTGAAGLSVDTSPPLVCRTIIDSMAASTAQVIDQLATGLESAPQEARGPSQFAQGSAQISTGSGKAPPDARDPSHFTDGGVTDVHVFGGGAQSELFVEAVQERTGLPVLTGPVEATAIGNALVQGIAVGLYADLAEARATLGGAS